LTASLLAGISHERSRTQHLESLYQQKLAALDELKKPLLSPSLQWRIVTIEPVTEVGKNQFFLNT